MYNPFDSGRDVGNILAEHLLTEQPKKKKRVIAIYAGRFHPFHRGHYSVYKGLVDKFGVDNVYIGTSGKVDMPKSPFPYGEKETIISRMFDIPTDKIQQVKTPFAPKEIISKFPEDSTAFVTAFSEKDAGRGSRLTGGYYQEFPDDAEDLQGYRDKGYFIVAPEFKMEIGGKNISGTQVRAVLGDPKTSLKAKKALFQKLYGKFDPEIFKLIVKRTGEAEKARRKIEAEPKKPKATEKKQQEPGNLANKTIVNPDTGRRIKVKSALSYDITSQVRKLAQAELESEAITMDVEVGDTILTGKFKNKKTVVKDIGKDDHDMPTINGRKAATFRMSKTPKNEVRKKAKLVSEGGAAGHMAHPFDDMDLTFADLKQLVEMGLEGTLNVEAPVTEKLDGQNISVSYREDRGVLFARNKSHLKNQGIAALDVNGIKQMFAGRGEVSDAFTFAARDLAVGIKKLSKKQRDKVFKGGSKWVSLEIIYPATQNVIPYGHNMLIFHNTIEVDDNGNAIGVGGDDGRLLAGMMKQINQHIQKTFTFGGPQVVTLPKTKDFARRKGHFTGRITRLQNQFKLSDNDKVIMWHQRWWEEFIDSQAAKFKYRMPNNVRQGLLKRWAYQELGSYSIATMKKEIVNKNTAKDPEAQKFLDWALSFDRGEKAAQFKKNIAPFERIFLQLGAEILMNVKDLLTVHPGKAAASLRKDIEATIKGLQKTTDVTQMAKVKQQLAKLNSIGLNKIVPTEGIVFMFKGKLFKFTGTFAPVNQLMGTLKFGR